MQLEVRYCIIWPSPAEQRKLFCKVFTDALIPSDTMHLFQWRFSISNLEIFLSIGNPIATHFILEYI